MSKEGTDKEKTGTEKNLNFFFKPESIALIGASPNPEKLSHTVLESLQKMGFKGKLYPVNPGYKEIEGLKCYSSPGEIEDRIDIAIFAVPAKAVLEIIKEPVENIKGAVIVSSGFREMGPGGKKMEEELRTLLNEKDIRAMGPNCLGIYDTVSKVDTFFIEGEKIERPSRGGVSVLTQSGSFAAVIMDELANEEAGVARVVSYGNKVDVDESDCLDFLAQDEATKAVALYIESVGDGRKFLESASNCVKKKPVVALKVGKREPGARAASSHTGAISGRYEAYEAAFRKTGIIEVASYEELKAACKVLNRYSPIAGKRVLIITDGGGIGISITDSCEEAGLKVPELSETAAKRLKEKLPPFASVRNPIDLTGNVRDEHYIDALEEVLSGEYDLAIVSLLWGPPLLTEEVAEKIRNFADSCGKPVLISSPDGSYSRKMASAFTDSGMPVFFTPENVVRAAAVLCRGTSHILRSIL
ncbi:Acetyl-CoA synthetase (ADP-forming) alpha chain [Methanosarcina siciliae T4/M]|uniref:acetate--CoA ligase (ADP-forming) n=1 Tax=Methanosarcina siciliae T4/M TaxID=1434120 RepID=A0A0E3P5F0_9EURY|nr:acetate--CoA ligase family protein [Methanosarcina siciliae]AKB27872.1 Acetyl-CoA synthetase (ADP-forming) alpha chain [Methanosarcina siciliae T4/M]